MKVAVLESWALGCKIVLKELTIEIQNPRSADKESTIQYSQTPRLLIPTKDGHLIIMDSLLCSWGKKARVFSLNWNPLIQTPG